MSRAVLFLLFLLGCSALATAQERPDVAITTALQGAVSLRTPLGNQTLQPFVRLKRGDQLLLDAKALVKLIYFESGRQEVWQGEGKLEIMSGESRATGATSTDARILPAYLVRQIGKTPSDGVSPQRFVAKSRSIAGSGSLERVDESYRRMRMEAVPGDLNPELYLLSALFEMREIARVEQVLADLRASRPADQEARFVVAMYQKAVRNFKESGARQ